jgi:hypothetical protein
VMPKVAKSGRLGNGGALANEATRSVARRIVVGKRCGLGAAMALFKLLNRLFHGPAWLKFVAMGVAAGGLALCSFNLLFLFQANFNLIASYGAMAAFDGGILQFVQLSAWGYLAMVFYLLFEVCLYGLIHQIDRGPV